MISTSISTILRAINSSDISIMDEKMSDRSIEAYGLIYDMLDLTFS